MRRSFWRTHGRSRKHFPPALPWHGASNLMQRRRVPWKQKLFWQGLENPVQFIPCILPSHFIRDRHSTWVGTVGASSSPPQIPTVESPVAVLRKQRAHQPPFPCTGSAATSLPAGHGNLAPRDAPAPSCGQGHTLHPQSFTGLHQPAPSLWDLQSPSPHTAFQVSRSWREAQHTPSQSSW